MHKMLAAILLLIVVLVPMQPSAQADIENRFSVKCVLSANSHDDPIVFPDVDNGSTHRHGFFGNKLISENDDYQRMLGAETSCDLSGDTAAYWVPYLENKVTGQLLAPKHVLAYYRSTAAMDDDPVVSFPPDFRFVSSVGVWMCKDTDLYLSPPNCTTVALNPTGLGLRIIFNEVCWDGIVLPAGSRYEDHTQPLVKQECPAGWKQLPQLALNVRYPVQDGTNWQLHMGVAPHGDFWNTWQQPKLDELVANCLQPSSPKLCGLVSD